MKKLRFDSVTLKGKVSFILVLFTVDIASNFMRVTTHEVSHGITAILSGGSFNGVYLSPFMGKAFCSFESSSSAEAVLFYSAGIINELILGVILFLVSTKIRKFESRISVFWLSCTYLVGGSYYLAGVAGLFGGGYGDIAGISSRSGIPLLQINILGDLLLIVAIIFWLSFFTRLVKENYKTTRRKQILFALIAFTSVRGLYFIVSRIGLIKYGIMIGEETHHVP